MQRFALPLALVASFVIAGTALGAKPQLEWTGGGDATAVVLGPTSVSATMTTSGALFVVDTSASPYGMPLADLVFGATVKRADAGAAIFIQIWVSEDIRADLNPVNDSLLVEGWTCVGRIATDNPTCRVRETFGFGQWDNFDSYVAAHPGVTYQIETPVGRLPRVFISGGSATLVGIDLR